jgi:hypothetical protein
MDNATLDVATLVDLLRRLDDVVLADGLTDEEVSKVESTFAFRFPPDLRQLLQYALPVSPSFLDWRGASEESLRGRLDWPADGICFDIENNSFWWKEWGPKPADIATAQEIARREIANYPTLIPIFSHRYIPEEPHVAGNPVFSIYQTDIIYYGVDLTNYFGNEFSSPRQYNLPNLESVRKIRFWSELVEAWGENL